jgi:hypothetical protein
VGDFIYTLIPSPPTYSISGEVSGYSDPVNVYLSGDSSDFLTVPPSGSYSFNNLPPGTYLVTAEVKAEYSISPSVGYLITIEASSMGDNNFTYTQSLVITGTPLLQGETRNHPNPFNPKVESTKIIFNVSAGSVKVLVYDLKGRSIWTTSATSANGYYEVTWDGKSFGDDIVSNGTYIYLIVADNKVLAKGQMMVWK